MNDQIRLKVCTDIAANLNLTFVPSAMCKEFGIYKLVSGAGDLLGFHTLRSGAIAAMDGEWDTLYNYKGEKV